MWKRSDKMKQVKVLFNCIAGDEIVIEHCRWKKAGGKGESLFVCNPLKVF